ncbi:DUF4386 domain-containing protein [Sphingomonas nostoxanthinifaciens]|uniref:DUF4386 domain-containing protein n=1 Tax=Sphingomonas nostoxanthinifaciens TaxID=2872652 RepID=UPI001CC1CE6B|nr:DUF4386 domain-containing protein [Sphingomonas nostoxanthinifaciens]UAK25545.1 DUF4386 domain-containing protein [Sphingomonas nostoxanthinifaciens]
MAALLYGLDAVIAPVSFALDPAKLVDGVGPAGAVMRIVEAVPMIRLNMLSEAIYQTVEVFLAIQMYRMFQPVNRNLAWQMFVLALMPIPIMFLNLLTEVGALSLAIDPGIANAFTLPQRDALASLMIRLHGDGVGIAGIFWGLWLLPLGMLIIRSGFVPKLLGLCELAGGLGWLLGSGAMLVMPGLVPAGEIANYERIASLLQIGELPFIIWLLVTAMQMVVRRPFKC